MTLGELRAWVLRTVGRPELSTKATDQINLAIEFASTQGDYSWDLVEGAVPLNASLYAQNIVISTSFTRFRKIKYLRPAGYKRYLTWTDPSRIFERGIEKVDTWYRAGDNLIFKLSALQSSMLYGYYQYPERLSASGGTNNYLLQMPSALHDLACSYLFDSIGNAEESARLEKKAIRMLASMRADRQDGVSFS